MASHGEKPRFGYWDGTWAAAGGDYSLREILSDISRSRYDGVELGSSLDFLGPADELKQALVEFRLEMASLVVPTLAADATLRVDYAAQFGIGVLMVGGGARPTGRLVEASDMAPYAKALSGLAAHAGKYGMALAQHTHPASVTATTDEALMLLDQVPDNVGICLDIAHAQQAGDDPVRAVHRLGHRLRHVHLKDYRRETDELLELGQGEVDIAGVMQACRGIGYQGWYTIELDQSRTTPFASACASRAHLQRLGY